MKKPKLSALTLREKIGQTAIVHTDLPGFQDLKNHPYGSIWACGDLEFGVDISKVYAADTKRDTWLGTIKGVNRELKIPLLQATDCACTIAAKEYGYVLDHTTIGATGNIDFAYETGLLRGRMLRHAGCNWAWTQIADIPSRYCASLHGRTYSDDPELLLAMNIAAMKGFREMGVATTAKHFPGEDGMEYRDAHFSETKNLLTKEEWLKTQGKMFQGMIDAGVDTIMTSHVACPFMDSTMKNGRYVPATLSYNIVTKLLKEEMGFQGVVISDDIWMRSIGTYCDNSLEKTYVECIKAGIDVVLSVQDIYFDVIEQAVRSGEIPESRIDDACQRVLDLKEKLGLFDDNYELSFGDLDQINADMKAFNQKAAKKAISLVCDQNHLFPLDPKKHKKICIIYSGHDKDGQKKGRDHMKIMIREFEKHGAQVTFQDGLLKSWASEADLEEISKNHDLIIYAGYLMRWNPHGMSSFYGEQVSTFQNALRFGAEKSIGVGLGVPFMYYDFYSAFGTYINAYNCFPENIEAAVAAMYGEIAFEGGEPFKLIPEYVRERLAMLEKMQTQNN